MRCKLVKLQHSGKKASIYSVYVYKEEKTLYERFVEENASSFKDELKDINVRLWVIGHKTGAREIYFKLKEGKPGDGVCALYDDPDANLRLYCIKYGSDIVVVGGGGYKPKSISALQEDPKLTEENYFLRWLSKAITEKRQQKEISFSPNGLDFIGDLEFSNEDDEE
jgi:hypothetical protein